jgi:hypothetical protein
MGKGHLFYFRPAANLYSIRITCSAPPIEVKTIADRLKNLLVMMAMLSNSRGGILVSFSRHEMEGERHCALFLMLTEIQNVGNQIRRVVAAGEFVSSSY